MEQAVRDGIRIDATESGDRAACPLCLDEVVAKVGRHVTAHWAHLSLEDCDPWAEGESAWHRDWKARFPRLCREVVVGPHRADVKLANGRVIELQSEGLSAEEFEEREAFYGDMQWIFDVREAARSGRIRFGDDGRSFTWSHKWKSILVCKCSVVLDLGTGHVVVIDEFPPEEERGQFVFDPYERRAVWDPDAIGPGRTFRGTRIALDSYVKSVTPQEVQKSLFDAGRGA